MRPDPFLVGDTERWIGERHPRPPFGEEGGRPPWPDDVPRTW